MDRLIGIKARNYARFARLKIEEEIFDRKKAKSFKAI